MVSLSTSRRDGLGDRYTFHTSSPGRPSYSVEGIMATGEVSPTPVAQEEPATAQGLTLYSYPYSFFSLKALLVLHEKHVQFTVHPVNIISGDQLQNWFLKLNPRAEVPVLKDGEKVIPDSAQIINYLEDKYNKDDKVPRLIPSGEDQELNGKHTHFTTIMRDIAIDLLTYGAVHHGEFTRSPRMPFCQPFKRVMRGSLEKKSARLAQLAERSPEFSEALTQKAERSRKFKEAVLDKAAFEELLKKIDTVLEEMETQLASNQDDEKWLLSKDYLLADVELTVLLERLYLLGLDERFWAGKPSLAKYYAKAKQRESYKKTMPSLMTHLKTIFTGITLLA